METVTVPPGTDTDGDPSPESEIDMAFLMAVAVEVSPLNPTSVLSASRSKSISRTHLL
ncbi:MAG TPA: hypothetical protein V6D12_07520 [Candidatus Obscuribacterales bacterium]